MNHTKELTPEEKSVLIVKAMGWHFALRPLKCRDGTTRKTWALVRDPLPYVSTWRRPEHPKPVLRSGGTAYNVPNLYRLNNFPMSWRVINWAMAEKGGLSNESKNVFLNWWEDVSSSFHNHILNKPLAKVQEACMDFMVVLLVEDGKIPRDLDSVAREELFGVRPISKND